MIRLQVRRGHSLHSLNQWTGKVLRPAGGTSQKLLKRGHQPLTQLNPGGFLQKLKMTAFPKLALYLVLALTSSASLSNAKVQVAKTARISSEERS